MMEYHFPPLGKTCAVTGKPLAPGTAVHSVLWERNGQFIRKDFSPAGWSDPPTDAVGYWRTDVPVQTGPPKLDPAQLISYFEQLTEEASPRHDESRFLLALLLLQLKRLRLDTVRTDDDGDVLVLTGLRGEGTFEVPHLPLDDKEISQRQLALRTQLAFEGSE